MLREGIKKLSGASVHERGGPPKSKSIQAWAPKECEGRRKAGPKDPNPARGAASKKSGPRGPQHFYTWYLAPLYVEISEAAPHVQKLQVSLEHNCREIWNSPCWDLHCFVAKSVLLWFTRFNVETNCAKNCVCGEKLGMIALMAHGWFDGW